ncbi:hypothetical protein [Plantibacter sp. YIM 135249]|uniref:hypothetical protein n=1 Tax=Plantibacter sp. YIM 135249 TaxID=3423918 RepID=UPI003D356DEB
MITAWDAFVASIDKAALEVERFGTPSLDERPGSRADQRMRAEHRGRVAAYRHKAQYPLATLAELAAVVAESHAYDRSTTYRQSPEGRAALRQKRNNEHRRAA